MPPSSSAAPLHLRSADIRYDRPSSSPSEASALGEAPHILVLTALAAAIPMAVTAYTMAAVTRDQLGMPNWIAVLLAAFAQGVLVVTAWSARCRVRTRHSTRHELVALWLLSALFGAFSAVQGFTVANGPNWPRVLVHQFIPLIACWMWHRLIIRDRELINEMPAQRQRQQYLAQLAVAEAAYVHRLHPTPRHRRRLERAHRRLLRQLGAFPDHDQALDLDEVLRAVYQREALFAHEELCPVVTTASPSHPLLDTPAPTGTSPAPTGAGPAPAEVGTAAPQTENTPHSAPPGASYRARTGLTPGSAPSHGEGDQGPHTAPPLLRPASAATLEQKIQITTTALQRFEDPTGIQVSQVAREQGFDVSLRTGRRWIAYARRSSASSHRNLQSTKRGASERGSAPPRNSLSA